MYAPMPPNYQLPPQNYMQPPQQFVYQPNQSMVPYTSPPSTTYYTSPPTNYVQPPLPQSNHHYSNAPPATNYVQPPPQLSHLDSNTLPATNYVQPTSAQLNHHESSPDTNYVQPPPPQSNHHDSNTSLSENQPPSPSPIHEYRPDIPSTPPQNGLDPEDDAAAMVFGIGIVRADDSITPRKKKKILSKRKLFRDFLAESLETHDVACVADRGNFKRVLRDISSKFPNVNLKDSEICAAVKKTVTDYCHLKNKKKKMTPFISVSREEEQANKPVSKYIFYQGRKIALVIILQHPLRNEGVSEEDSMRFAEVALIRKAKGANMLFRETPYCFKKSTWKDVTRGVSFLWPIEDIVDAREEKPTLPALKPLEQQRNERDVTNSAIATTHGQVPDVVQQQFPITTTETTTDVTTTETTAETTTDTTTDTTDTTTDTTDSQDHSQAPDMLDRSQAADMFSPQDDIHVYDTYMRIFSRTTESSIDEQRRNSEIRSESTATCIMERTVADDHSTQPSEIRSESTAPLTEDQSTQPSEIMKIDDFVVVEFTIGKGKKSRKELFVGTVVEIEPEVVVDFLRESTKETYVWPMVQDISIVEKNMIKKVLPPPKKDKRGRLTFSDKK